VILGIVCGVDAKISSAMSCAFPSCAENENNLAARIAVVRRVAKKASTDESLQASKFEGPNSGSAIEFFQACCMPV
jgi:hypothetical protein